MTLPGWTPIRTTPDSALQELSFKVRPAGYKETNHDLCESVVWFLRIERPTGDLLPMQPFGADQRMYGFEPSPTIPLGRQIDEVADRIREDFPNGHRFVELMMPEGAKDPARVSHEGISARVLTHHGITRVDILVGPAAPKETSK